MEHWGLPSYPWTAGPQEELQQQEEEAPTELEAQTFECVACSKKFRSEKQLRNHESSRKHLEMVAVLREVLQGEELEAGLPTAQPGHGLEGGAGVGEAAGRPEKGRSKKQKQKRKQARMRGGHRCVSF